MNIKFSYPYQKLHGQKSAVLLYMAVRERDRLPEKFVEYDTSYFDNGETKHFPLPPDCYIILVFLGCDFIPFTTVRRYTEEKYTYYRSGINDIFEIIVKGNK